MSLINDWRDKAYDPNADKGNLQRFWQDYFLKEKDIYVRYFKKPRIDGYLRISMGTDDEMDEFLKAVRELM